MSLAGRNQPRALQAAAGEAAQVLQAPTGMGGGPAPQQRFFKTTDEYGRIVYQRALDGIASHQTTPGEVLGATTDVSSVFAAARAAHEIGGWKAGVAGGFAAWLANAVLEKNPGGNWVFKYRWMPANIARVALGTIGFADGVGLVVGRMGVVGSSVIGYMAGKN